MGGSGKNKHRKSKRKSKSGKSGSISNQPGSSNSIPNVGQRQSESLGGLKESKNKIPYSDVNLNVDMSQWNCFYEDQLEKLLYNKLGLIYAEAFQRLLALGYPREVAEKAILMNGHGLGPMNLLSNIVTNSIAFINSACVTDSKIAPEDKQAFKDLSELVKCTQEVMVNIIQEACPNLQKSDAVRHLLATNLHVGPASDIIPPFVQSENQNKCGDWVDGSSGDCKSSKEQDCSHADSSYNKKNDSSEKNFDAPSQKDVGFLKRFNLTPILASRLKKNVVTLAAAYRPDMKASPIKSQASPNSLGSDEFMEEPDWEDSELLRFMVGCSNNISLEEWLESKSDDPKYVVILSLVKQIRELKAQVKEQKEWAQEKVIQAAKKLSQDLSELRILRAEKLEKEQLPKIELLELEDKSMERLLEMENALRKSSCQVDLATAAVRRLEIQNSEMRAEVEACELSASVSDRALLEVTKRERKCLRRATASEKQSSQLREQIEEQKKQQLQLDQQLLQLKKAQEEAEVKWRLHLKAKELASALIPEEVRKKEVARANLKRKRASLHQEMEMGYQRLKDDVHRLEHEISHLQMSRHSSDMLFQGVSETDKSQSRRIEVMPFESCVQHDSFEEELFCDRKCVICSKNEVSIVFLPCTHQVLCAGCNEDHCKTAVARCPCCQVQIGERVRVYGASS